MWGRIVAFAATLVVSATLVAIPIRPAAATEAVSFGSSQLAGTSVLKATSLQWGPDDRLYVAQQDGTIHIYSVRRNGPNDYSATDVDVITSVKDMANHNDDGTVANLGKRQVTGIYVTGTATQPEIYVSSSDPRIGAGSSGTDKNLDTNSGILSVLTQTTAGSWTKTDLVRGLPRNEENHSSNGMVIDGTTLYLAQGGHTNMGGTSNNFALQKEYALSAAILAIDLSAITSPPYDLPTLDDPFRAGVVDANDPFGGNNGLNQAILDPFGPVQIHSPGYRNPYDVIITESGRMYTFDNGPNAGWGDIPKNEGPAGLCTDEPNEPGVTHPDGLHLVTGPGYYAGHPNPTRGNMANTFNGVSPVPFANPVECDYRIPGVENGALMTINSSTNGLTEYTASNFGGAMKGDLLAAAFSGWVHRIKLNADGDAVIFDEQLFANFGTKPLDVVAQGDDDPFPGTVWAAVFGAVTFESAIQVFEPSDFDGSTGAVCTGLDRSDLDEDGDGFSNADEILNGTDPCSAADLPPDADGDGLSDLLDPDDDNDGLADTLDRFAVDPDNGTTTSLPVSYTWDTDAANPGGLMGLGFTGLMTNGVDDYLNLFDPGNMTGGGAAGVTTVDIVPTGDALGSQNDQQYGFQFGVNPDNNEVFTAHTAILGPFAGVSPLAAQSMGLFVGTGDQDNYVKIVTSAANGGAIAAQVETGGIAATPMTAPLALPGPSRVDLYLTIDRTASTVAASFSVDGGPLTSVGTPQLVPASWFDGPDAVAVGIISTAGPNGVSFPATWGLIEAYSGLPTRVTPGEVLYRVNAGGGALGSLDASMGWSADSKSSPSQYVNALETGNKTWSTSRPFSVHSSVPGSTPLALFNSARWDPKPAPEMRWSFPVSGEGPYEVRLYFADMFPDTQAVGARTFDVTIEGQLVLDNYDIYADVGGYAAVMKRFTVTSDDSLDVSILFGHRAENPEIRGLEILAAGGEEPPPPGSDPVLVGIGDAATVQESGDDGSTILDFPLSASGGFAGTVTVSYSAGGASGLAAQVSFATGTATLPVAVPNDDVHTGPTTLEVSLTGIVGPAESRFEIDPANWTGSNFYVDGASERDSPAPDGDYTGDGIADGDDTMYATERFGGAGGGSVTFTRGGLAPGDYVLTLKFAEIWDPIGARGAGARVFDVIANGQLVIDDLDLMAVAGLNNAYDIDVPVTIGANGVLTVTGSASSNTAKFSAIALYQPAPSSDLTALEVFQAVGAEASDAVQPGVIGSAVMKVTPNASNIQISNFGNNSFTLQNTGDKRISAVFIDATGALYPDVVFDMDGSGGDHVVKPWNFDSGQATAGAVSTSEYQGYWLPAHDPNDLNPLFDNVGNSGLGSDGGFRGAVLKFTTSVGNGFEKGETVGFSGDMDSNSLAGFLKQTLDNNSIPSWDAGGVSGAEMIGSKITILFTDGTTATGQLVSDESLGGAHALITQAPKAGAATVSVNGFEPGEIGSYGGDLPEVVVGGPAGSTILVTMTKGIQPVKNTVADVGTIVNQRVALLDFPANNAVEFQTIQITLGANETSRQISNLFDYSNDPNNYDFDGNTKLPLGFVASVVDPVTGLGTGPVSKPIYLINNGLTMDA